MTNRGSTPGDPAGDSPLTVAEAAPRDPEGAAGPEEWTCLSHETLFATARVAACDACGCELAEGGGLEEADDLPGRGLYLWTRGDEVRLEEAPLCAACASAIGMTALARWEIEEEEG